jgi:DNA-binding GntR family transcriptional regulator
MTDQGNEKKTRRKTPPAIVEEPELTGLGLKPAGLTAIEQSAFQKLVGAIAERRLLPGVRLVEEELAEVFGVSRERIRRILLVLSQHDIIRLEPNRGAYVARPTYRECRDAFEGRRLIERHVVTSLARLGPARRRMIVSHLRRHIEAESAAIAAGDRTAEVRLSGEFHLKMAAYAGNLRLVRMLQDLIAQMSLAMAAHTHPHDLDCSLGEHSALLDAILTGDSAQADRLLVAHLDHMEAALTHGLNADGSLASVLDP